MEKRYTVKEYAAAAGITQQAAYKRIKSGKLQTVKEGSVLYVLDDSEVETGGLNHSTTGLNHSTGELNRLNREEDILNHDSTDDSTGEVEKVETVCNHSTDSFNQLNQDSTKSLNHSTDGFNQDSTGNANDQLVRLLQKQLDDATERNRSLQAAIEEKDRVIYDLSRKLAEIASGATQNAARQQLLTAAATARQEEQEEPETEPEIEPGADGDQQQPQKKRGFFARLFGLK